MDFELSLIDPEGTGVNPLDQNNKNEPISMEDKPVETFVVGEEFEVSTTLPEPPNPSEEEKDEEEEVEDKKPEPAKKGARKAEPAPAEPAKKEEEEADDSYALVAEALHKWGVIEEFDAAEFDGTVDSLKNLVKKTAEAYHKAEMEKLEANLSPKLKKELGLAKESFVDDDLSEAVERIESLNSISQEDLATNLDLAKTLYRESLMVRGFSKEKAERYIKIAEEENALVDEALDAKDHLLEVDQSFVKERQTEIKKQQDAIKEKMQKDQETLKSFIFDSSEFVPGLPLSKQMKQTIFDSIHKPVGEGPNGKPINRVQKIAQSNAPGFQALLHYYTELGLFNQDKDGNFKPSLEKIQTVAKSKVVKDLDLETNLRNKLFKSSGQQNLHDDEGMSLLERIRKDRNKS